MLHTLSTHLGPQQLSYTRLIGPQPQPHLGQDVSIPAIG